MSTVPVASASVETYVVQLVEEQEKIFVDDVHCTGSVSQRRDLC